MSIFARYKERVQHQHGWEVELRCPQCNQEGVPQYIGWTPSNALNLGETPTIYANLSCPECGHDLKQVAAEKLRDLFKDVSLPPRNKGLLYGFMCVVVGLPVVVMGIIWAGVHAGWWGNRAFLSGNLIWLIGVPAIFVFNYKVHSIRFSCECGNPRYLFMGMLGRSYCYRCSCGRLLRVRD